MEVRKAAAVALGQIGSAREAGPLIAALKDKNRPVREAAALALGNLGWKPGGAEAGAYFFTVKRRWRRCVQIGPPAVKPLIAALGWADGQARRAAAKALVEVYRSGELSDVEKVREYYTKSAGVVEEMKRKQETAARRLNATEEAAKDVPTLLD